MNAQVKIIIILVTFLLVGLHRVAAQVMGFAPSIIPTVPYPTWIATGDVNGDGRLDLITANYVGGHGNTLTVLTNNGIGGFGFNATLKVGTGPVCVVAVDLNNNGRLDLVSANTGSAPLYASTLTVLTNNGSGGFGSNATIALASSPTCVATADINNDGKPDLIAAIGSNQLIVFTNNGSGSFGSNATYVVGSGPRSVLAADINGDGNPDLICANYSVIPSPSTTLTVLTNNGSGGFGSNTTLTVGKMPFYVTAADVNGDGKLDLICANYGSKSLTVLTNDGFGNLGLNATLTVGVDPQCVAAVDINDDGKLDLISADSNSGGTGTLTIYTNNGNGSFGFCATITVGNDPAFVVSTDVNGDGKLDLISANNADSDLTLLTQVIAGPPTLAITLNGNNPVVSWSSFSTSFTLQTNSDLTTTNWSPIEYPISVINGTNLSVTVTSPPLGNLFFRLVFQ